MGKLTFPMIKYYRNEIKLSFRDIGHLLSVTQTAVWNFFNNYNWRNTKRGKPYAKHQNHYKYKDDCSYCEIEKRKDALHSKD